MSQQSQPPGRSAFEVAVLSRLPGFSSTDEYFFVEPLQHVMSGFVCEKTPRGAYIWKFVFPLFDPFKTVSLSYSQRLAWPAGYIDFKEVPKALLAQEFVRRIEPHAKYSKLLLSLPEFRNYLAHRPETGRHEHLEMVLGFTCVLIGEQSLAALHLGQALPRMRPEYREYCERVLDALADGLDSAQREVLSIEVSVRQRLGLPAVSGGHERSPKA